MIAHSLFRIGIFVACLLLIAFGLFWWLQNQKLQSQQDASVKQAIDPSTYQVVTLDNGKTYFGKLRFLNNDYVLLEDVYFLKPSWEEEGTAETTEETTIALQHIRNQLYEPADDLYIRSEDITSWQNLQRESRIVKAIKESLSAEEE